MDAKAGDKVEAWK